MSITLAVLAGALAVLNPCAFAMLPAFLSLHVGSKNATAPRRFQAMRVGLTVTVGAVTVFAVIGIPITLGARQLAAAIPWVGLALGLLVAAVAIATLAGKRVPLPDLPLRAGSRAWLFGASYRVASLSCSLPIFLVVIGDSVSTRGEWTALAVFAAYTAGMAIVFTALALGAALMREGIARCLTRLLPHLRWITGGPLLLASGYLLYYWATVLFAAPGARTTDPIITATERLARASSAWAGTGGGRRLLPAALTATTLILLRIVWRWARADSAQFDNSADEPLRSRP